MPWQQLHGQLQSRKEKRWQRNSLHGQVCVAITLVATLWSGFDDPQNRNAARELMLHPEDGAARTEGSLPRDSNLAKAR